MSNAMLFALGFVVVGGVLIIAALGTFLLDRRGAVEREANISSQSLEVDNALPAVPDA